MFACWMLLTILEGVLMGVAKLFHGLVGSVSPTMPHVTFAVALVGAAQTIIGCGAALLKGERLLLHKGHVIGFCVFGLLAQIATLFAFLAFRTGARADMGTHTFLVNVPIIVPAAIIGHVVFKERLQVRHLAGGLLALLGCGILLAPSLRFGSVPEWAWWSLITMLAATGTATTAKTLSHLAQVGKIPQLNTFANIFALQFWGGIAMSLFSVALLVGSADGREVVHRAVTDAPWLWMIVTYASVVAVTNMGWWSCRQLSFQHGAPLCFRLLPWLACSLSTATLAGVVVFHDPLPWQKVCGLLLFVPAIFVSEGGWQYCPFGAVEALKKENRRTPDERI
jgi:drug/metabolite transporter (DMT)-like permease